LIAPVIKNLYRARIIGETLLNANNNLVGNGGLEGRKEEENQRIRRQTEIASINAN
jgi:hypothetical protein